MSKTGGGLAAIREAVHRRVRSRAYAASSEHISQVVPDIPPETGEDDYPDTRPAQLRMG